MLQRVIVIALVLSSHISLCAGSFLGSSMALLSQIGAPRALARMTPDVHSPLCMLQTPDNRTHAQAQRQGCGGGKKCIMSKAAVPTGIVHAAPSSPVTGLNVALEPLFTPPHHALSFSSPPLKPPGALRRSMIAAVVARE
jgi:hypothetical protein